MNCQEFENLVVVMNAERSIDAVTRQHAIAHAMECGRCAALLVEERVLACEAAVLEQWVETSEPVPAHSAPVLHHAFETGAGAEFPCSLFLIHRPRAQTNSVILSTTAIWVLLAFVTAYLL